jgi:hypothetical protein
VRIETDNEFIRGSSWRVRTTPRKRALAAAATFLLVAAVGLATMYGCMALLRLFDPPQWVVLLPWLLPTAGMLYWTMFRPSPAIVSDDDDDSWVGYSMRLVLFGADVPQALPIRVVAAILLGALVVWAFVVFTILELVGVF